MVEPPVSVMFVDNTTKGALVKKLQEVKNRLGGVTAYRVRMTEQAGMSLARMLPSTNPWGPGDCGRMDCGICSQQDEKQQDCRKRNILYENHCQVCKLDLKDGETESSFLRDGKGKYVGESSRSMYERAKEHQRDRDNKEDDSHQIKHWRLEHPELPASRIHYPDSWQRV